MRNDESDCDGLSSDERLGGRRRFRRAVVLVLVLALTLAVFVVLSIA
jgi:predicted nucleic acid-binding Zn ribbon protein